MFEEAPFSSDDDAPKVPAPSPTAAAGLMRSRVQRTFQRKRFREAGDNDAEVGAGATVGSVLPTHLGLMLHHPRDPQFRSFAAVQPPALDASSRQLDGLAAGDLWTSKDCHCLQCDMLRAQQLLALHLTPRMTATKGCSLVLLWDLDNFGFRELQRTEPAPPRGHAPLTSKSMLWGFYGACFARHYKCPPEDLEVAEDATLGQYRRHKCALFTPCGGHKEAVDEVLVAAANAVVGIGPHVLAVVVTGDKHLARYIDETLVSKPAEADCGQLRVLDVNALERKIGNVWKALRELVAQKAQ